MKKIKLLIYGVVLLNSVISFAQPDVGNGGGGEIQFHSHTNDISDWLHKSLANQSLSKKLKLESVNISEAVLVKSFSDAVKITHVKFIPNSKLSVECNKEDKLACELMNNSRTCMNTLTPSARIVCNEDFFNKKSNRIKTALVFHEYLGISKIEVDDTEDFSQYPVSKYIMKYINDRGELLLSVVGNLNTKNLNLECVGIFHIKACTYQRLAPNFYEKEGNVTSMDCTHDVVVQTPLSALVIPKVVTLEDVKSNKIKKEYLGKSYYLHSSKIKITDQQILKVRNKLMIDMCGDKAGTILCDFDIRSIDPTIMVMVESPFELGAMPVLGSVLTLSTDNGMVYADKNKTAYLRDSRVSCKLSPVQK